MEKLTKNSLCLVGSASTLDVLKKLIVERLYWSFVDVSQPESSTYESRLGKCYDVINGNGTVPDMVIINGKNGRWSLYRINS